MDMISILLFVVPILVLVVGLAQRSGHQGVRLARLERKVDAILKHLGVEANADVTPEVLELVKAGKKIEAIKRYRDETGVGLKEAKEYVESL
jgi:ribosomal protein L7/L12